MAPRWIGFTAGAASSASDPDVLFERDADYNFVFRNPGHFPARPLRVRDMLQNFRAEYAIKRVVSEVKLRCVSRDRHNVRDLELRTPKVERCYFGEMIREQSREMTFPRANVEH